jgi:hypothetical protein
VFEAGGALFTPGESASEGVRDLAEDGKNFPLLVEAEDRTDLVAVGTFAQVDAGASYDENPIGPGIAVSFEVVALPGQVFGFAAMFVQSNDVFIGSVDGSVALFEPDGTPRSGELTEMAALYDAGTEVNEQPGVGPNQAPRQANEGEGEDESEPISLVDGTDSVGFVYPAIPTWFRLTLEPR